MAKLQLGCGLSILVFGCALLSLQVDGITFVSNLGNTRSHRVFDLYAKVSFFSFYFTLGSNHK